MRMPGRISPSKAAKMLNVHVQTIQAWCQKAIAGEPSKLTDVVQHITGYYWIDLSEVRSLQQRTRHAQRTRARCEAAKKTGGLVRPPTKN